MCASREGCKSSPSLYFPSCAYLQEVGELGLAEGGPLALLDAGEDLAKDQEPRVDFLHKHPHESTRNTTQGRDTVNDCQHRKEMTAIGSGLLWERVGVGSGVLSLCMNGMQSRKGW